MVGARTEHPGSPRAYRGVAFQAAAPRAPAVEAGMSMRLLGDRNRSIPRFPGWIPCATNEGEREEALAPDGASTREMTRSQPARGCG